MIDPRALKAKMPEAERVAQILSGSVPVHSVAPDRFGNKSIVWKCPQDDQFLCYVTDTEKIPEKVCCPSCRRTYSLQDPEGKYK